MRQLRRGTIRLDLELDLHGLNRDEALDFLASFITAAVRRGQQAVLVITGKGNNSQGEPVLASVVSDWLRQDGKQLVTEFCTAPPNLGGDGALVVFLKTREVV
jgi:DNA-nicking Smr family endonuclease